MVNCKIRQVVLLQSSIFISLFSISFLSLMCCDCFICSTLQDNPFTRSEEAASANDVQVNAQVSANQNGVSESTDADVVQYVSVHIRKKEKMNEGEQKDSHHLSDPHR